MRLYSFGLSFGGMSSACAAGLRPARNAARQKNFGFTDRTGVTRKRIGKVRRYRASTARRYGGGGAYFRGGGIIGATLEWRFGRRYSYLEPALRQTESQQLERFLIQANKEVDRVILRAREGRGLF